MRLSIKDLSIKDLSIKDLSIKDLSIKDLSIKDLVVKVLAGLLVTTSFVCSQVRAEDGNATDGEAVFKKCMACHRVGEGAKNLVGPVLNGVIGRQAGTAEGYAYSTLNKNAGANGLVWNEERIFTYLEDPNGFLRKFLTDAGKADLADGSTKMPFKLTDETDRKDVIAYLRQFSKK